MSSIKYSAVFNKKSGLSEVASPSFLMPSSFSIRLEKLMKPQIFASGFLFKVRRFGDLSINKASKKMID